MDVRIEGVVDGAGEAGEVAELAGAEARGGEAGKELRSDHNPIGSGLQRVPDFLGKAKPPCFFVVASDIRDCVRLGWQGM